MRMCASLAGSFILNIALVFALTSGASAQSSAPVEIEYELPKAAQVSIVIKDQQGRIVRELLHAAKRQAGAHTETWNGLNDEGEPVEPGDYHWQLLTTQGLDAKYLMSLGTNTKPRWAGWPGNHGPVVTVAADAQGRMFAAGSCGEGTPLLVAQTISPEKRLWTVPHWLDAWQGGVSMARGGESLYMLQQNHKVYRFNAKTGERLGNWNVVWKGDEEVQYQGYDSPFDDKKIMS